MQRLGVLGGTFDPIHIGHLVLALWTAEQRSLDAVVLVPAGDPWQKSDVQAPAVDRLAMVQLAVEPHHNLVVSTVDIDRPGPSYTVDTIAELQREYPGAKFEFIVGSDALAKLPTWKNYQQLLSMVTFIVAERPGTPIASDSSPEIAMVRVLALEISSSNIRTRVARGESISYLVPSSVAQFIERHDLYRNSTG